MKEYIGKVLLNLEKYKGEDLYSDGDIEYEILDIVKNHQDDEYNEIIKNRGSWPIMYHLSHMRTNIIDWIPITKGDHILEIGSGCGAITGKLSDKGKSVTCIELSKLRSSINAYRNKEKDNINILVGNYQDIESSLNKKYEYVTLIGVFEYAESYIQSSNPYIEMLKNIKNHLSENGKIIIAIENKFGLKYWSGCKEDHTGIYFEGIEGYSSTKGVKTFSKKELENLFKNAGFKNYKFYYPYPDYKFPVAIYSDEYLPKKGELNKNINLDTIRLELFDELSTYDNIISDGMFDYFSNSYLIILNKDEGDL